MKNKKPLLIILVVICFASLFTGCAAIQSALVGTPLEGLFGTPKPDVRIVTAENLSTEQDILDNVKVEIKSGDKTSTLSLKNSSITYVIPSPLVVGENEISATYDGVTATAKVNIVAKTYGMNYFAASNGKIVGKASQRVQDGLMSEEVTATPNNAGYEFRSWTDGVTEATRSDLAKELNVTATFSAKLLTVTFYDDVGKEILPPNGILKIKYDTAVTVKDVPKLDFLPESKEAIGFFDENGKKLDNTTRLISDTKYTLRVKNKTVEIKYLNMSGETIGTIQLPYGDPLLKHNIDDPLLTGYTFKSWDISSSDVPLSNIDMNKVKAAWISFTPKFTINTYVVKFENDDGSSFIPEVTVEYDNFVTAPTNSPVRSGYEFNGWKIKGSSYVVDFKTHKVINSVTLVPNWKAAPAIPIEVTVLNRMTGKTDIYQINKGDKLGETIFDAIPKQTGKTIKGIRDQNTMMFVYPNTSVENKLTLEIVYEDIICVITFKTNIVGQTVKPKEVTYGGIIKLPTHGYIAGIVDVLVPQNMQLNGWKIANGEYFDPKTPITTDLTLDAEVTTRRVKVNIKSDMAGSDVYINGIKYSVGMEIDYDTNIVFKIILNNGTSFTTTPAIRVDGSTSLRSLQGLGNNEYTTTLYNVRKDTEIEYSIDTLKYSINYSNVLGEGGGIVELLVGQCEGIVANSHNSSAKTLSVVYDAKLVFKITPYSGYRTVAAYFGDELNASTELSITNNTIEVKSISKLGKINVTFDKIKYGVSWRVTTPIGSGFILKPDLQEVYTDSKGIEQTINRPFDANEGQFSTIYNAKISFTNNLASYKFEIYVNNKKVYAGSFGTYTRFNLDGTSKVVPSNDKLICHTTSNVDIEFRLLERAY